jgi:hypothetical protein
LGDRIPTMALIPPFCPLAGINGLRIAGLRATVLLLLTLLIKAKIRIQAFSALGLALLLLQTLIGLAALAPLALATIAAAAYALNQRPKTMA